MLNVELIQLNSRKLYFFRPEKNLAIWEGVSIKHVVLRYYE
jgi:hypothetical protein